MRSLRPVEGPVQAKAPLLSSLAMSGATVATLRRDGRERSNWDRDAGCQQACMPFTALGKERPQFGTFVQSGTCLSLPCAEQCVSLPSLLKVFTSSTLSEGLEKSTRFKSPRLSSFAET